MCAHGGGAQFLYGPDDAYLEQRVREITGVSDVLLAMEFSSESGQNTPFPVESWEHSDYLITPTFLPDPH